jgi:transposase
LGSTKAFIEGEAPRVECRRHGVVVARTAWARHGSRFTRAFEQQVAWLATHCSKSAICELMRISWPSVGRIIERVVVDERARQGDPLEGLRRIGIDELSFRKGQRYITVVVDARWLKGARWALWKRPERLSERQQAKLASIEAVNRRLYRAYLLKEQLRLVFHSDTAEEAIALLDAWLGWARRCRIPSFVKLAKTDHREQGRDRRDAHPPALKRADRSDQHHVAADHPPRLRLPLRPSADRPRDAHRRRPPTLTPRPQMNPRKPQELLK